MNIVPFNSNKLPARLQNRDLSKAFAVPQWAIGGGFPVISIKGKVFHIVRSDERTLVTKPDSDEPASSIEVVIIKPADSVSKVYYKTGFTEGSSDKPTCYSNDGVAPAADAVEPQAKKCAVCPHNVFGSKITENGAKSKACADTVRLAVAPAGQLNDAMLLRVPATSIKSLREYYKEVTKRGVDLSDVITKVSFDPSVAYPALTFKPIGFIDDEMAAEVEQMKSSDIVGQILGSVQLTDSEVAAEAIPEAEPPKPAAKPAKVKAEPKPEPEVEEEPVEAPKPAAKAAKAAKSEPVVTTSNELLAELDNVLADLGLDSE